ncbi:peptidoglycan-binding protein [Streptomyces lateritius]|uniref:peptidoglycan-binding domain-containing protein n=1 Tax=Streptomyces lateritius TaxID=67313 RepID=UPI001C8CE703|nr:peptidoglycan-binding domain-containing protein [Streptomyces lateritius]MBX9427137.1 peptidoglycan-binding protein [Streptomyces lateritius]
MSALLPQCGGRSRCACLTPREAAGTYQGETRGEFDQEWVRPYLPAQDAVPDGTTETWVIPRVPREAELPPEPGGTLPPVVMTQAYRRGREAPKRRRAVHLTAALAALAGSAAIAGAYAFSQGSDPNDMAGPQPASGLEVLDGGQEPLVSPPGSQANTELQQRLRQLGLWPHPLRGHFNRHLQDAVQRFQAEHGISDDSPGVYGPATRHQLESMTS